jgi:hypothetical protein
MPDVLNAEDFQATQIQTVVTQGKDGPHQSAYTMTAGNYELIEDDVYRKFFSSSTDK